MEQRVLKSEEKAFLYIVLVDCRNAPKLKVQILDCCALTHLTRPAADSSSLILYELKKQDTLSVCVSASCKVYWVCSEKRWNPNRMWERIKKLNKKNILDAFTYYLAECVCVCCETRLATFKLRKTH